MTRPQRVRLTATRHTWRISTDTGWTQGWWAFTQGGLHRAVQQTLRSCGMRMRNEDITFAIDAARQHGYVDVVA